MRSNTLKTTLAAAVVVLATASSAAALPVKPVTITSIGNTAPQGSGSTEIAGFHAPSKRIFATDAVNNELDIFDLTNPAAPTPISSISLAPYGATPNSVAVSNACGGRVLVAIESLTKTAPGTLAMFDTSGAFISSVVVGSQPDMVKATAGGKRFVVANEGEPETDGSVDPDGTISIATMRSCNLLRVSTVGFAGVPTFGDIRIFGPGATLQNNIEPEYVAIAPGGLEAVVTLQENNAVATVNLLTGTITAVRGLGFKNHGLAGNGLDPSDKDGGIHIAQWANAFGMYQPDGIAAYRLPGELHPRYITANEGDARDWTFFKEEKRVKELTLDTTAFPASVKTDANLGRLTVTNTKGDTDNDGDFDELYAFGARSASILSHNGTLTYDTGDAFEQYIAANDPANFNVELATGVVDSRSDNKGPESEGVAVGRFKARTYAFVVNERNGGILALDLSATPGEAKIAGYINTRAINSAPEGISFIPAAESPNGKNLLLTSNEGSGTVGVFELN